MMSIAPLYNPVIPYIGPIHTPLTIGSLIRIQGNPHTSARCFAINLQCGPMVNPRDDICLHLSPVFTPPPRVVRNSLQGQRWGPEESYGGVPLVPGQGFELMILLDNEMFKIAINGQHFTEFRHRIPFNRISHIAIDGDVSIAMISFEPGIGAPYTASAPPPPVGLYPSAVPYPSGGGSPYGAGQYTSQPYPSQPYPSQPYPSQPYPSQPYPSQSYPAQPGMYQAQGGAYPSYPHSPGTQHKSGGIAGTLGGLAAGAGLGAAASSIGGALLGRSHGSHGYPKHHKSSPIPIAGLAAGAGAAALGAAVLTGHHPFKKAKKLFKHKGFKHKGFKPKFFKHKGWKHKGWSSSSSD